MKQFAVIGLGNFGYALARELMEQGAQVIAVDKKPERVETIKEFVTDAVTLEAGDEVALKSISIHAVDIAIVCIGDNVEANLLVTVLLKKLGVKKVWARAISPLQQEILKAIDVDYIISIEHDMGQMIARSLVIENAFKHTYLGPGYSVVEIKAPESFVGTTLRKSDIRTTYNLNVIGIKRKLPKITSEGERTFEETIDYVPSPDTKIEVEDILILVGEDANIAKFSKS